VDLPKNEKTFIFDHAGEVTGHKYGGNFTVKCILNMAEKRTLEIEKSMLSADLSNPTGNLSAISSVIANLRVRVIKSPDWFKQSLSSLDLLDEDVYFVVYGKCLEQAKLWTDEVKSLSSPEKKEGN
jgi:hypothetical protein